VGTNSIVASSPEVAVHTKNLIPGREALTSQLSKQMMASPAPVQYPFKTSLLKKQRSLGPAVFAKFMAKSGIRLIPSTPPSNSGSRETDNVNRAAPVQLPGGIAR